MEIKPIILAACMIAALAAPVCAGSSEANVIFEREDTPSGPVDPVCNWEVIVETEINLQEDENGGATGYTTVSFDGEIPENDYIDVEITSDNNWFMEGANDNFAYTWYHVDEDGTYFKTLTADGLDEFYVYPSAFKDGAKYNMCLGSVADTVDFQSEAYCDKLTFTYELSSVGIDDPVIGPSEFTNSGKLIMTPHFVNKTIDYVDIDLSMLEEHYTSGEWNDGDGWTATIASFDGINTTRTYTFTIDNDAPGGVNISNAERIDDGIWRFTYNGKLTTGLMFAVWGGYDPVSGSDGVVSIDCFVEKPQVNVDFKDNKIVITATNINNDEATAYDIHANFFKINEDRDLVGYDLTIKVVNESEIDRVRLINHENYNHYEPEATTTLIDGTLTIYITADKEIMVDLMSANEVDCMIKGTY